MSQKGHDRLTISGAVLEAVASVYGKGAEVLLVAHDRGARATQAIASHRSDFPDVVIKAAVMIDIVPYVAQWHSFANPQIAAGYFHWSFLPTPMSSAIIKAYGAGQWAKDRILSISGPNDRGRELLTADGALEHYAAAYENDEVVEGAKADYTAGATVDYQTQLADKEAGRLVDVPSLVLYSGRNLGSLHDVDGIWKQWVKPGVHHECYAIGKDAGHFIPEENPDEALDRLFTFFDKLGF